MSKMNEKLMSWERKQQLMQKADCMMCCHSYHDSEEGLYCKKGNKWQTGTIRCYDE